MSGAAAINLSGLDIFSSLQNSNEVLLASYRSSSQDTCILSSACPCQGTPEGPPRRHHRGGRVRTVHLRFQLKKPDMLVAPSQTLFSTVMHGEWVSTGASAKAFSLAAWALAAGASGHRIHIYQPQAQLCFAAKTSHLRTGPNDVVQMVGCTSENLCR